MPLATSELPTFESWYLIMRIRVRVLRNIRQMIEEKSEEGSGQYALMCGAQMFRFMFY
jgi:hypothetical protein